MMLVIEDEAGTRSTVPFAGDAIVVGRGADGVTVRLPARNVSRRHARFLRQSGSVFVEDLGSLTGTRVNGERISGRRKLREGDLVQIADYDLALLAHDVAASPGAPPPLPGPARPEPRAGTARLGAPGEPGRTAPGPGAPGRGRTVRLLLVAGLLAIAVAIAGALAAGSAGPPAPPPITRP